MYSDILLPQWLTRCLCEAPCTELKNTMALSHAYSPATGTWFSEVKHAVMNTLKHTRESEKDGLMRRHSSTHQLLLLVCGKMLTIITFFITGHITESSLENIPIHFMPKLSQDLQVRGPVFTFQFVLNIQRTSLSLCPHVTVFQTYIFQHSAQREPKSTKLSLKEFEIYIFVKLGKHSHGSC